MAAANTGENLFGMSDNFAFGTEGSFGARQGSDVDTPTAAQPISKNPYPDVTPSTPTPSHRDPSQGDARPTITDTLLWKEPFRTGIIFVTGALFLALWWYIVHGNHNVTFMTGLAYVCLGLVGVNCILNLLTSSWSGYSKWTGSNLMKTTSSVLADGCAMIASTYDKYLLAVDPVMTVKVVISLWSLTWLGSILSTWQLAALLYVGAFSLPAALHKYRKQIDKQVADASTMVRVQLEKLKLSRMAYFGIGVTLYVGSVYLVSWSSVVVMSLLIVAYMRTLLKPAEVDAIRNAAEPYTTSVRRFGSKAFLKADEVMVKLNLSPAPKPHYR